VADLLPSDQRTLGYSVQTALIGIGAVIGSWLPYALSHWFGVASHAAPGQVPYHLVLSFIIGAVCLVGSVLVTILTTTEYSPEELAQFDDEKESHQKEEQTGLKTILSDFLN